MLQGRRRVVPLVLIAAIAAGLLSGCVTMGSCVSWVDYETPQDAFDDAGLVVTGTPSSTGRTREVFGVAMPVYAIDVREVHKGEAPEVLEVVPAPLTCMGEGVSEFPDGVDPLATDDEVLVFLTDAEGGWRAMTPWDGVITIPSDGVLPFDAPDR